MTTFLGTCRATNQREMPTMFIKMNLGAHIGPETCFKFSVGIFVTSGIEKVCNAPI